MGRGGGEKQREKPGMPMTGLMIHPLTSGVAENAKVAETRGP